MALSSGDWHAGWLVGLVGDVCCLSILVLFSGVLGMRGVILAPAKRKFQKIWEGAVTVTLRRPVSHLRFQQTCFPYKKLSVQNKRTKTKQNKKTKHAKNEQHITQ